MKPRYKHDCDSCKYLGRHEEYDLYFCNKIANIPTVIARFNNRNYDYMSGMNSNLEPLIIAQKIAIEQCFYNEQT